jgi:dUTP pyrophosphatase
MTTDTNGMDHNLMENIDSENKAYFLGWIAGVGNITDDEIEINSDEKDNEMIQTLRNIVSTSIPITKYGNIVSFKILSEKMADDVTRHLQTPPVSFPHSIEDDLKWDFVRGYFDSIGSILNIRFGYPKCRIESLNNEMIADLVDFSGMKASISDKICEWTGVNALDFLSKLYKNADIFLARKRGVFISLANHQTSFIDRLPMFKWARTIPGAPKPEKNRFSDSGYDLHLVKKIKVQGGVHYFDTGIQVQPENGYYFDLVGRSSISKTGWMLANNIGIIDASYRGTIIVALVKIDPEALEIELPCKLVQLIPRQLILMEPFEVEYLDDTERGEKGFGSSGK